MYKIINRKKLLATRLADLLIRLAYLPVRLFSPPGPIKRDQVKEILVIRTAYIGDVVMTIPLLRPLREGFPGARITFLAPASAEPLLRHNPDLDAIVSYDPFWFYGHTTFADYRAFMREFRKRPFDLVIESRADIREILMLVRPLRARYKVSYGVGGGASLLTHVIPYPGLKHKVDYHLDIARFLGCPTDPVTWGIHLTDDEQARVTEILRRAGISGPFVAAHPGSRVPLKRWLDERYAAVYDAIHERYGLPVVLLGSGPEVAQVTAIAARMMTKPVILAGQLAIRELAGVLQRATLFLCNDSGPMHVAVAVETPCIALFGPSKSSETAPYGPCHRVVEKEFPCRLACDEGTCLFSEHHACMKAIQIDDVLRPVAELMAARPTFCL